MGSWPVGIVILEAVFNEVSQSTILVPPRLMNDLLRLFGLVKAEELNLHLLLGVV